MTAFETAWDLMKSFYFGGASERNMEGGVFRPTWLTTDRMKQGGTQVDTSLPQNQPGFFGANLSQQTQEDDPKQRRSAYRNEDGSWMDDEKIAEKVMGNLGHEQMHFAQGPALREAYGIEGNPLDTASGKQFSDLMTGHEYGATSSTNPDLVQGALDYAAHPQLNNRPKKEEAAEERYRQLASGPFSPSFTQGFRSQENALRGLGASQQEIDQSRQQGKLPQQMYQERFKGGQG